MSVIVHLLGSLDVGGAERRMLEILRARDLTAERHVFVTLSGRSGTLAKDFQDLGCAVVPRALGKSFPLWFVRFLRRSNATHIHSHVQLASGYLLLLGVVAGVPRRIAHFRSTGDGRSSSISRRLYRLVGRWLIAVVATDVVAVSESAMAALMASATLGRPRRRIIYDQIDGERFGLDRHPRTPPRIIMIGRLDREKNPARAVAILAALRDVGIHVELELVGRCVDAERDRVLDAVKHHGLEGRVHVLGERSDVPELLAGAALLLSTSTREGLPGAVIEAVAAGTPAVVSDIGPNTEVARHLSGVIPVPLSSSDAIWCDVIVGLLADPTRTLPERLRESFDASPFSMRCHSPALDELWSR